MRQLWRAGLFPAVLICLGTAATPQGLFESSQQGNHENEVVSNHFSLGGFIRSAGYVASLPEHSDYYFQSVYGQASLLMDAKVGSWTSAMADIRFRAGNEFQETVTEWMIREAYVDFSGSMAGIRMGKMITPWGKGTVYNPTDKITPMDPTRRSPDEDDLLLGSWGVQGYLNLGSYISLAAAWKPLYQSSVLLIDPVPMPDYVRFTDPWDPGTSLSESSYGINLDLHHPIIDAALYWFSGYNPWPGIRVDSFILDPESMQPELLQLLEHPYRIRMAGLDFSLPLGSWIIRTEGAWQESTGDRTSNEHIPFPELAYAAEIERSLGNFDLVAGYYGKYIMDYEDPVFPPSLSPDAESLHGLINGQGTFTPALFDDLVRNQIASFNRLYNYQLEPQYHSAFVVISGQFFYDILECAVPLIYNFTTEEWMVQPRISYRPADGVEVSVGFSGLYGPGDSLYDLVGPVLNAGYVTFKISF
jgi:hypothetical protein